MNKESQILLEEIDTNCNTCKHFNRDLEWAKRQRHKLGKGKLSHSAGYCRLKKKDIKVSNGVCIPEYGITGQNCWISRRQ